MAPVRRMLWVEDGLIYCVEIGFDKGIFERRDEVKERASWKQSGDAEVSEVDESAFELSLSSIGIAPRLYPP